MTRPHYQLPFRPGDVLCDRQWCVPTLELLGRSLVAGAEPRPLEHNVVVKALAVDDDGPKARVLDVHVFKIAMGVALLLYAPGMPLAGRAIVVTGASRIAAAGAASLPRVPVSS